MDATGDASESVRVQYLDDESDDESIEYTISDFIRSADPAPIHVDLTDVTSSVSREQPAFQMPDRGELVPLQRKRVRNPASWANHGSTFDTTWGNTFNLEGQGRHVVPECTVKDCDLDCAKITHDVLVHARNKFHTVAKRGVNERRNWLALYIRPKTVRLRDSNIWANYSRRNVKDGRQNWKCSYCKCTPNAPSAAARADTTHRFKKPERRPRSKFASCPDYETGSAFRQKIISTIKSNARQHTYHVPVPTDETSIRAEYQVHMKVFQHIFNIGQRLKKSCQGRHSDIKLDGRAGSSGRRPHTQMQERIENFWMHEVDKEPSHYDSLSTKQHCVGVSSSSHGYLIFLARYFPDKYAECVEAQYFPGVSKTAPEWLKPEDVPVMACDVCITLARAKQSKHVVCPHIPKPRFFRMVASRFKLGFKRPGSDQCEECNTYYDRIVLLRAMG